MAKKTLTTTSEVVRALGGDRELATVFNLSTQAVANWRYSNQFPANTYLLLDEMLRDKSIRASASLWAMKGFD